MNEPTRRTLILLSISMSALFGAGCAGMEADGDAPEDVVDDVLDADDADASLTAIDVEIDPQIIGGDLIRHDSIQNLYIAKGLSFSPNGQGSDCDVWNQDGNSTYKFLDSNHNCTTANMNGRTYSWTVWNDTDAFTMRYENYWVKSRDGSWHYVNANVYTRFHDDENVHCYRESDGVNCYVSFG